MSNITTEQLSEAVKIMEESGIPGFAPEQEQENGQEQQASQHTGQVGEGTGQESQTPSQDSQADQSGFPDGSKPQGHQQPHIQSPQISSEEQVLRGHIYEYQQAQQDIAAEEQRINQMRGTDPGGAALALQDLNTRKQQLAEYGQAIQQEAAKHQGVRMTHAMQNAHKQVTDQIPAWKNNETAKREIVQLLKHLQTRGYSQAEINNMGPHAIRDAYNHMKNAQPRPRPRRGGRVRLKNRRPETQSSEWDQLADAVNATSSGNRNGATYRPSPRRPRAGARHR